MTAVPKNAAAPHPVRLITHWARFADDNGLGRNFVKAEMANGGLPSRMVNGKRMVLISEAETWLKARFPTDAKPSAAKLANLVKGRMPKGMTPPL